MFATLNYWIEDDGLTLACDQGVCYERRISLSARKTTFRMEFSPAVGTFPTAVKAWRIVLRNAARPVRVRIGGESCQVQFDPEFGLCAFEVANRPEAIAVEWR